MGLLREVRFRRYWIGQSASLLGSQVSGMAVPLTAVLVLGAESESMGLLTAVRLLPALLFSIHAGVWIERLGNRRLIMIFSDLARAVFTFLIPVAYVLGWLSLWTLLALTFLVGTFGVLFRVASSTLFVSLVPRERYVEANSLLTGSRSMAFIAGPGIGGFLVQLFTAPGALVADGLSFVASALSLATIRTEEPPPAPAERGSVSAGLRYLLGSPVVRAVTAASATANLFLAIYFALYVLYATRSLGVSPVELGLILGPGSAGGLVGSAMAGRVIRRIGLGRTFLIGVLLFTVPMLLVPMAGGPHRLVLGMLVVAECLSGMGVMLLDISKGSILSAAVPDEIRNRTMGAVGFIENGVFAAGALLGGALPALIGLHATMWVATAGACLGVLWLLPSAVVRLHAVDDFAVHDIMTR